MLNDRRRACAIGRRISLRVLSGLTPMLACNGLAPRHDPVELRNHRVDGIVAFGQGLDNEMLFAVRDGRRFAWSAAPLRIPATGNASFAATGPVDSAHRPLVVLVRTHAGDRPYASASLLEVGPAVATAAGPTDTSVRRCLEESWISAFFIAGLGPIPRGAVTIKYTVAGSTYRLRVDPEIHTVHATPALQLTHRDIDGDGLPPEKRVMSFQPSYTIMPVLPLVVRREARRWRAHGGTGGGGNVGIIMGQYASQGPPLEWRFYMLDAPPPCQAPGSS
jgi:hypothetical protein